MLTEKEAAQRWCPVVRSRTVVTNGPADVESALRSINCIGSRCMAWRGEVVDRERPPPESVYQDLGPATEKVRVGYCGLAGKP